MQRSKNTSNKNSTQNKIKAIRELQRSVSEQQFPKNAQPKIPPSEPVKQDKLVQKTHHRKTSKIFETDAEATGDFSYSRTFNAKKDTKKPSDDLTKPIFLNKNLGDVEIDMGFQEEVSI